MSACCYRERPSADEQVSAGGKNKFSSDSCLKTVII